MPCAACMLVHAHQLGCCCRPGSQSQLLNGITSPLGNADTIVDYLGTCEPACLSMSLSGPRQAPWPCLQ